MFAKLVKIRESKNIPIIMLSAKGEDSDKILGLNVGADDYITKPFNNLELVARVKSQLRRYDKPLNIESKSILKVRDLEIDTEAKKIIIRGEEVKVTATEYKILLLLVSNLGKILSIKEIYENVWEEPFYKSENMKDMEKYLLNLKNDINNEYFVHLRTNSKYNPNNYNYHSVLLDDIEYINTQNTHTHTQQ